MGQVMGGAAEFRGPEHLTPAREISAFAAVVPDLGDRLTQRTGVKEHTVASGTYVVYAGGWWATTRLPSEVSPRSRRWAASVGGCRIPCR